jgi:hypothetical protein
MFGSASSIGRAIGGGIWNKIFLPTLLCNLPDGSKGQSSAILVVQMSHADDNPESDAIVNTYGYIQRLIWVAGVAIMTLTVPSIFIWKDANVKMLEEEMGTQTKGTVLEQFYDWLWNEHRRSRTDIEPFK